MSVDMSMNNRIINLNLGNIQEFSTFNPEGVYPDLTSGKAIADGEGNTINEYYAAKSEIPISTSELVNDSGFISNTASDLLNYYLKAETYTKDEVNYLISQITTVTLVKVDELPDVGEENKIYLVPKEPKESNNFNEYIWVNNAWELIGSTEIDVSGTYPNMTVGKAEKDGNGNVITSTYATKEEIETPIEVIDGTKDITISVTANSEPVEYRIVAQYNSVNSITFNYDSNDWSNVARYEVSIFFRSLADDELPTEIFLSPSSAPIKFYGVDCNSSGVFTPEYDKYYELNIKFVGMARNAPKIVARVGEC